MIFSGSVVENSSPEQIYHAWVKSLEPMWIENAKRGGYYRWFSGFCRIRDITIDSSGKKPWQCEVITSANNIVKAVRLSENPPVTFRALDFDSLYANCKYAYMADVNNGYGCSHPEQEETGSNENGETEGKSTAGHARWEWIFVPTVRPKMLMPSRMLQTSVGQLNLTRKMMRAQMQMTLRRGVAF